MDGITRSTLSLLRPHDQRCVLREALDVFLMLGLGVAGAVEVFHECDEGGATGWCEGCVVGDFVGHCDDFCSKIQSEGWLDWERVC